MVNSQVDDTHKVDEVQTPILENMVIGVPPVFEGLTKQLDKIVEQPLLGPKVEFPAGICPHLRTEQNIKADKGQRVLHTRRKMTLEDDCHRRSRIEGSRQSSQRTQWEHSEEP